MNERMDGGTNWRTFAFAATAICGVFLLFGFLVFLRTGSSPPAELTADFEDVGFGRIQGDLLAQTMAGAGTEETSRRLQLLDVVRKHGGQHQFTTDVTWDETPYQAHWDFDVDGRFCTANIVFPLTIEEHNWPSVVVKALLDGTPAMLVNPTKLIDTAFETGTAKGELAGFSVAIEVPKPGELSFTCRTTGKRGEP